MKQNAAILALLVGAVAAQRQKDNDVKGPIFKSDKAPDQCTISGDTTVSGAAADKKVSSDEVVKLQTALETAIGTVTSERTARDEAVLAVIEKDKLFKAALDEADAAENEAMALYKTANTAQKAWNAAQAAEATMKPLFDAMKIKYDDAVLDKAAALKAVNDGGTQKITEDATLGTAKTDYGGVIDASDSDGGGDCSAGACKVAFDAKATYNAAQGALAADKLAYDNKVIEKDGSKPAWDVAKAAETIGLEVKATQTAVVGANDAAGKKLAYKTPNDLLVAYGAATEGDLYKKQTAFNTAADAAGEAWKVILDNETNSDYGGNVDLDCTNAATAAYYVAATPDVSYNPTTCAAKCQELSYFDKDGTKIIVDSALYCYGYEVTSADKCHMWKKAIPIPLGNNSALSAKGCYTRTASVNAVAFFTGSDLDGALATAVTAYSDTIVSAWDILVNNQEDAARDLDMETQVATYIQDIYLDKADAPKGLSIVEVATKKVYDDFVAELPALKSTADAKGMDDSVTLASPYSKTMAALKKEWDDAAAAQATKLLEWNAATTEATRQDASNTINGDWKIIADAAFDLVEADYKGSDKMELNYDAAKQATIDTKATYDAEYEKYTLHIAKTVDYVDKAAKAAKVEDGSAVALQKDVFDSRVLANAANTKVKDALKAEADARIALADEVKNCAALELKLQEALEVCEAAQYATFRKTFQDLTTKRTGDLGTIKDLMVKRATAAAKTGAGSGLANARCERPRSNGDKKTRTKCAEELCCGAATKIIGQTEVTIETCQKAADTKYAYQPPRAAMKLAMPATESWDFACIAGAQRVLAAAAAAAAAGLMMQ